LGRRSARREDGLFVLEGPTLVREALETGAPVRSVLVDEALAPDLAWLAGVAPVEVALVAAGVLARVLDTVTPQPIAATVAWPVMDRSVEADLGPSLVPVLAGVADPGNVGTLLRSASAAGASGVILTEGTADAFGPKAVRASAGAVLRLPVRESSLDAALSTVRAAGLRVIVADARGPVTIDEVDLRGDVALLVGNEVRGVPSDLGDLVVERVSVPMDAGTESLNVAMAATVLLFEAARQRRMGGSPD
jgi:RNA methyltransferase, TrmH family